MTAVRRYIASSTGAVSTEYAFILAFGALVAATGFVVLGDGVATHFEGVSQKVNSASVEMPNPLGGGGSTSGGNSDGIASGETNDAATSSGSSDVNNNAEKNLREKAVEVARAREKNKYQNKPSGFE